MTIHIQKISYKYIMFKSISNYHMSVYLIKL